MLQYAHTQTLKTFDLSERDKDVYTNSSISNTKPNPIQTSHGQTNVEYLASRIVIFVMTRYRIKMNLKELPDFVQKILIQIIENNGFSDYSVEIGSGSQAGDGFLSKLYKFTITEEKHDKILVLVCKLAPLNKIHRKEFFSDILFNREALFYDKLMPIFDNFQVGKNVPEDNQFQSYPKCYGSLIDDENEQYTIILEDLRPQGYEMWNKAQPSPIENVRLAMRELGKFHGLSVAMKNQKPTEFSEFKQVTNAYIVFLQSKNVRGAHYAAYDRAIESLKNEDHRNIMHHIKDNLLAYVEDCFDDRASERFGVLCHGIVVNLKY